LDSHATIKINDQEFEIEANDLQLIQNLGHGANGIVDKMMHRTSGAILAVKVGVML
jgi:mitogen-activated protein kinase kinase 6